MARAWMAGSCSRRTRHLLKRPTGEYLSRYCRPICTTSSSSGKGVHSSANPAGLADGSRDGMRRLNVSLNRRNPLFCRFMAVPRRDWAATRRAPGGAVSFRSTVGDLLDSRTSLNMTSDDSRAARRTGRRRSGKMVMSRNSVRSSALRMPSAKCFAWGPFFSKLLINITVHSGQRMRMLWAGSSAHTAYRKDPEYFRKRATSCTRSSLMLTLCMRSLNSQLVRMGGLANVALRRSLALASSCTSSDT
mmetsp:Transcript_5984/g.15193  ORF Transcript_5984/g.15193 Transcript_5984/m.15193 type:complete len:247 (+) Transcript_5984:204-944(+)